LRLHPAPMRVAMVSEHASPLAALGGVDAGGQNVHVAALATALGRRGARVTVHTRRDSPDLPPVVDMAAGVKVHHVAAGPERAVPKDDLLPHMAAFADVLFQQWEVERPDIVHAHFWMSGLAALWAARPLGIPVVMTFHALGRVKRRHQGPADTSPPERLRAEEALVEGVDQVVATCADERGELEAMGADPARVAVIPCGVDLELFTPDGPVERRRGRPRLVTVGRLVKRKGVDDVIRALPHLPGVELVVAGGPAREDVAADPEGCRLLQLAATLGVADRVDMRGRVPHHLLPPLLRSADVVACTPWYEPFGMVPLEAMACGVPVVAAAVGGLNDSVVHEKTGLLVPPRQPRKVAGAVSALLARPTWRAEMGAASVLRAGQRYSWAEIAARTEEVYAGVRKSEVAAGWVGR
jgi:D-inositol-3-phosphate glycosyltransferase